MVCRAVASGGDGRDVAHLIWRGKGRQILILFFFASSFEVGFFFSRGVPRWLALCQILTTQASLFQRYRGVVRGMFRSIGLVGWGLGVR